MLGPEGQPCTMIVRDPHWTVPHYWIWGLPFYMFYSTRLSQFLHRNPNQSLLRTLLCLLISPLVSSHSLKVDQQKTQFVLHAEGNIIIILDRGAEFPSLLSPICYGSFHCWSMGWNQTTDLKKTMHLARWLSRRMVFSPRLKRERLCSRELQTGGFGKEDSSLRTTLNWRLMLWFFAPVMMAWKSSKLSYQSLSEVCSNTLPVLCLCTGEPHIWKHFWIALIESLTGK